jgi:hypothetical protein
MHAFFRRKALVALGTACALVALASAAWPRAATAALADTGEIAAAQRAETARIRRHFDRVLVELRAPVARPLTTEQRAARAAHVARLQAYRDRGVFPHNHDFSDGWMPYFVDHRGVRCAVAYLLEESGRADIVERVRAADNNIWVASLEGDAEFARWLDETGLTLAEAARIQVPYIETPPERAPSASSNRVNTGLAVLSGGLGAASIVWNARAQGTEHRGLRAALGHAAGAMGVALAASRRDAEGGPLAVGIATGAIGIGSAVMGTGALSRGRGAADARSASKPATTAALSVAPAVLSNGDRLAPGVTMHLRF